MKRRNQFNLILLEDRSVLCNPDAVIKNCQCSRCFPADQTRFGSCFCVCPGWVPLVLSVGFNHTLLADLRGSGLAPGRRELTPPGDGPRAQAGTSPVPHLSRCFCTVGFQAFSFVLSPSKSPPSERTREPVEMAPKPANCCFFYCSFSLRGDLSVEAPRWRHVQDAGVHGLSLPHAARPLPPQRLRLSLRKCPDAPTPLPGCLGRRLSPRGCSRALAPGVFTGSKRRASGSEVLKKPSHIFLLVHECVKRSGPSNPGPGIPIL